MMDSSGSVIYYKIYEPNSEHAGSLNWVVHHKSTLAMHGIDGNTERWIPAEQVNDPESQSDIQWHIEDFINDPNFLWPLMLTQSDHMFSYFFIWSKLFLSKGCSTISPPQYYATGPNPGQLTGSPRLLNVSENTRGAATSSLLQNLCCTDVCLPHSLSLHIVVRPLRI